MTACTMDREDEDRLYAEQERLADAEKGQQAREEFEKLWEEEIRRSRRAAGLCALCGRPLALTARIGGKTQHAGCKSFSE